MKVTFGKEQDWRTPVYINKEKIGFIAITGIQHKPTEDDIIRAGDEPTEDDHMWHFFDERTDKDYARKTVKGFIIEENDDLGRSWFERRVSGLVVKVRVPPDKLSSKSLARINRFVSAVMSTEVNDG